MRLEINLFIFIFMSGMGRWGPWFPAVTSYNSDVLLQRRHRVSNHRWLDCCSKAYSHKHTAEKTLGLHIIDPLWRESTGGFPHQKATKAENVSMSWRHHGGHVIPLAARSSPTRPDRQPVPRGPPRFRALIAFQSQWWVGSPRGLLAIFQIRI